MMKSLKIRMPITDKCALESKAKKLRVNYRTYLVDLLRVAISTSHEPEITLDTRIELSDTLKDQVSAAAKKANISPENYARSVFTKNIEGGG